jgi:hypothetical protein
MGSKQFILADYNVWHARSSRVNCPLHSDYSNRGHLGMLEEPSQVARDVLVTGNADDEQWFQNGGLSRRSME